VRRLIVAFVLLASACASAPVNDEAGVRAAMMSFMDALNALDADRITAAFAEDATTFFPLAQPQRAGGRAEIGAIFHAFVEKTKPQVGKLSLVPEDMQITTSGDLALVTFQIKGRITARRTFVFRRTGGKWLIAHLHASDFKVQ
jgi:ketosteroid isomerase-like protein